MRVNGCCISANGARLAIITMDNHVIVHDYHNRKQILDHVTPHRPTGIDISRDGTELLVSMYGGGLLLLSSDTGATLQRYVGIEQRDYVIRARFGGANQGFVVSGSENSRALVWRKSSGRLVADLSAHEQGAVNAVAWHPVDVRLFATAGDDSRVRV